MVLGLIGAVVLASGSLIKAVGMIVLGLLMGLIGTDVNSGVARFSFDIPELTDGVGFIVIAMGVFGYGEIISNLSKPEEEREVFTAKVTGLLPTAQDFKNMAPAVLRGTALGSALGILPGGGTSKARGNLVGHAVFFGAFVQFIHHDCQGWGKGVIAGARKCFGDTR
jgi:TctA family transporter